MKEWVEQRMGTMLMIELLLRADCLFLKEKNFIMQKKKITRTKQYHTV